MTGIGAARPWLLAIDTATSRIVVAAGRPDGRVLARPGLAGRASPRRAPPARRRAAAGRDRPGACRSRRHRGGNGPGRVHRPSSGSCHGQDAGARAGRADRRRRDRRRAAPGGRRRRAEAHGRQDLVLLLPGRSPRSRGGPRRRGRPPAAGRRRSPPWEPASVLVAVDLAGRAPEGALARGEAPGQGLARGPPRAGRRAAARPATATTPPRLVPEYVTLPRGVRAASGEIEWSHGPR